MANGINKVTLVGRTGSAPKVNQTKTGGVITSVSLATNESWTDKQTGQKKESTEWHNLVFFGKVASIVKDYVGAGDLLYIEGKLKTTSYDKNGVKMYKTEIVVDGFNSVMQILQSKRNMNGQQQQPQQQQPQQQPAANNSNNPPADYANNFF
jgi:single-strand DNA-binding protein